MSENDGSETEVVPTAMVVAGDQASLTDLADLGFITPIATPARLRAAFAEKQRLYAAILDESDYIYTVSYTENGKTRQNIYTRREDAEKAAKAYGVDIRASPKKSGIVKLASALGIQARRKMVRGLPDDPVATYSYVVYEATHQRTGRSEEGIGWCDKTERGGRISSHDVIATADTRAYNRAILRLAGFGDVSADEIVAGASLDEVPSQPEPAPKKPLALPASTADDVLTAQRWWAEESAKREAGFLPDAQQNTKAAREMRAKARRGDTTSARQMGSLGLSWQGVAQDSISHETFEVEAPIITLDSFAAIKKASGDPAKPGWDLSGTGSAHEENRKPDEKPVTREQAAAGVPAPGVSTSRSIGGRDGSVETITSIQAKNLSELLLSKLGTKDAAQAWLRKHADVERSSLVRQNQYDALKNLLTKEN